MIGRRSGLTVTFAIALAFSVGVVAQKKDDNRTSAQKKEIEALVKAADGAAAGQAAPNDLGLAWGHEDYMKAANNKQYVPFTVTLDTTKIAAPSIALYWRLTAKTAAAAAPAGAKKDDKNAKRDYPYEDVSFVPVTPGSGALHISRSFTVAAGDYDVLVAVHEVASGQKGAPAPKTAVLKQSVTVPDFWNNEFTTSSVIIAQRIDPLPAPLTREQQIERPYAIGNMEIVPVPDLKFSKKAELSTFMLIYNEKADANNKPDVIIEYNFYSKVAGAEKAFNHTSPQNLNPQTLPPQFDVAAGHQLQTGQAVPLASFPEGDYHLEIKVTDKIANKTITRDVNFSVTAS